MAVFEKYRVTFQITNSRKAIEEMLRVVRIGVVVETIFELVSILEPGKLAKIDKDAILVDVVRKLAQLRNEVEAERLGYRNSGEY
ncbi:hypothetical protein Tco_0974789 [Tanacetum coccineum]|uniref:ACT domain-containing protein n=1 Tax=Tanacetum coccineum TaxID=301880 RepID=A0ABQ5ECQ2_9ASTR